MYDPIVVDSWPFIIIDREVGLPFRLIDIVQDALLMLVGDPSPRQMAKRVIREIIPSSVQEIYLEEIQIECTAELRYPPPGEIQHEGNRWRCFDPDPVTLSTKQSRTTLQNVNRDDNRFIRRIIEDMERYGIVSLAHEYEEPQTRPLIVQGSDGAPDLYFPYEDNATRAEGERAPSLPLPSKTCLTEFAQAYKQKHPNAIMAKGSIQTHYCAWPMPAIKSLGKSGLNFATWEGHVYRWNAMRMTSRSFLLATTNIFRSIRPSLFRKRLAILHPTLPQLQVPLRDVLSHYLRYLCDGPGRWRSQNVNHT